MPVSIPGVTTNGGEGPRGRAGGTTGLTRGQPHPFPPHSPPWWGLETLEDEEAEPPFGRWRGQAVNTPSWWWELVGILEVSNFQELAQKIWASFNLPQ